MAGWSRGRDAIEKRDYSSRAAKRPSLVMVGAPYWYRRWYVMHVREYGAVSVSVYTMGPDGVRSVQEGREC